MTQALRFAFAFALSALVADIARAEPLADDEVREGFFRLITGADFSGWRFSGTIPTKDKTAKAKAFGPALDVFPDNWKAGDGMIQLLKGGNPNLATQWDFDDFDVRLQWRAHKKTYNSGFYVRSGKAVNANQINLNQPAVGELINTAPELKERAKVDAKGVPELHKVGGSGEWNDWRVLAVGKQLTFWVNGTKAWHIDHFVPARGYLGLQAEGTIDFRNLRIREMGYELFATPTAFRGDGWTASGDVLTGKSPLATPKAYRDCTLRLEFRGQGTLKLGDGTLPLGDGPLKGLLLPEGQFNYLQATVANGEAKLWLNGTDLKATARATEGPITLIPAPTLDVRHFRVRTR